jgi:hypothetical protein
MRGFLNITLRDAARAVQKVLKENDLFVYEADRFFRLLVDGNMPTAGELIVTPFFKGNHTYDTTLPFHRVVNQWTTIDAGTALATLETFRLRRRTEKFHDDFAHPSQQAFAAGSAAIVIDVTISPRPTIAAADFGLGQIGGVFGHRAASGGRAYYTEPVLGATGAGAVNTSGPLSLGALENWHHQWDIRITKDGDDGSVGPAAEYCWLRRPYSIGAYQPGYGQDALGTDILADRFPNTLNAISERSHTTLGSGNTAGIFRELTAGTLPSAVPYTLNFPTPFANVTKAMVATVSDEQDPQRLWMIWNRPVDNTSTFSDLRALWSWKSYTIEPPARRDAADGFRDESLTGWPVLGTAVQFRDLAMTRYGHLLVACDGDDDDANGADNGALIAVNTNAGSEAVDDVFGSAVAGIYTVGGLLQNNVLAVAVDRSENYTAAGTDRIWMLHRNGLTYIDQNTSTGVFGAAQTVANSGATFNVLDANSIRGIANPTPVAVPNSRHQTPMLQVDSSGDVYWLTSQTAGTASNSIQRLNKVTGDATTLQPAPVSAVHSWYSLHTAAEGGAIGKIDLGKHNGSTYTCFQMRMFLADTGDTEGDSLWVCTGYGGDLAGQAIVREIPISEWGAVLADNPGAAWYKEDLETSSTVIQWQLQVDKANNAVVMNGWFNTLGILEPMGNADFIQGEVDSFGAPAGGLQTLNRNTGVGNPWNARIVGKRIRISGGTNAANRGSFVVDSFTNGDTIAIRNAGGASTGAGETAPWDLAGTEFDTFSTGAFTIGSWANGGQYTYCPGNWYVDDSGLGFIVIAATPWGSQPTGALQQALPSLFNWSGSAWYRRRQPHLEAAGVRAASASAVALRSGVTLAFQNQNAGVNEFFADENYTFGSSPGVLKEATQEFTYGWDLYSQRTELLNTRLIGTGGVGTTINNKTASHSTAVGGYTGFDSPVVPTTDNPFLGGGATALANIGEARKLAMYQRRLFLNGAANTNTPNLSTAGTYNATNGTQIGVDLGSDTIAAKLRLVFDGASSNFFYGRWKIDLYSNDAAAGPGTPSVWVLRASYDPDNDYPGWIMRTDAFRNSATGGSFNDSFEVTVDLAKLDGDGNLNDWPTGGAGTPGTENVAQRYWKFVITEPGSGGGQAGPPTVTSVAAFDVSGNPIGIPADKRLDNAEDSNWMACYVLRATWEIDDDTNAGGATVTSSGTTVTLSAGNFDTDVLAGDFLRILGTGAPTLNVISEEYEIDTHTPPSGTLTLVNAPPVDFVAAANWEIVRNADVRPRDDEGGTPAEDQAQFPDNTDSGDEFKVYICPVTGHIFYHDDAVTNSRKLRIEDHVKVKRNL